MLDVVSDTTAAHPGFCRVISEHNDQFRIGDIIRAVAIIGTEHITHRGTDLCGTVAAIATEKTTARVHQTVRDVRVGDVSAIYACSVQDMYSLIAVIFQDPPKIITDGIQGFIPTYPFKFTFTALADALHGIFQPVRMIHPSADRAPA